MTPKDVALYYYYYYYTIMLKSTYFFHKNVISNHFKVLQTTKSTGDIFLKVLLDASYPLN